MSHGSCHSSLFRTFPACLPACLPAPVKESLPSRDLSQSFVCTPDRFSLSRPTAGALDASSSSDGRLKTPLRSCGVDLTDLAARVGWTLTCSTIEMDVTWTGWRRDENAAANSVADAVQPGLRPASVLPVPRGREGGAPFAARNSGALIRRWVCHRRESVVSFWCWSPTLLSVYNNLVLLVQSKTLEARRDARRHA